MENTTSTSTNTSEYRDYGFINEQPSFMHDLFTPVILDFAGDDLAGKRVLDVGCGNGALCGEFARLGCHVTGIDLSPTGIEIARRAHPRVRFEQLGADRHLLQNLGGEPFDIVVSTEVIEHVYAPRDYAFACHSVVKPGGAFICTTPYHGYLKNLAISLAGKWDHHANPLWDCGHIKLFSRKTLGALLEEAGFANMKFRGVGRFPLLWMTMIVRAERPVSTAKIIPGPTRLDTATAA